MKTVVISGGSSGIGESITQKFITNGYYVYNLDIVDNIESSTNKNYKWLKIDVSKEEQVRMAIESIVLDTSHINILIANAGKHLSANIENTTSEQLQELMNLNLFGSYWLIKYAISYMKDYGGSIITIGSDQCSIAKENSAVYGMTKAALNHLTKSTALDYAKFNIRVNCIGAGTVDTPLYQNAIKKYSQSSGVELQKIKDNESKEQPLGRIGSPNEIAELVYFLTQDGASYITGALIPIDGGYIAR